jgi:hypothetical protein
MGRRSLDPWEPGTADEPAADTRRPSPWVGRVASPALLLDSTSSQRTVKRSARRGVMRRWPSACSEVHARPARRTLDGPLSLPKYQSRETLQGNMRPLFVYISDPPLVWELRACLQRSGCVAEQRRAHELEVYLPSARSEKDARRRSTCASPYGKSRTPALRRT